MNRESNYKKKLLLALLLIVAGLAGTLMPQRAAADDVVNAPIGSSGLTWSYTEATKTLTISNPSGTPEAMPNFSYQDGRKSPWAAISEKIETVTIEDGVTTIGTYAFDKCWALNRQLSCQRPYGDRILCLYELLGAGNHHASRQR